MNNFEFDQFLDMELIELNDEELKAISGGARASCSGSAEISVDQNGNVEGSISGRCTF